MGKISDIWVRLGLKKEGYDKGMNDAEKKAEGFGGTLNKVKAGALAVWAAIGASVIALGKQIITATNQMEDAWAMFTTKAKAGWGSFVKTLINGDWSNFVRDFKQTIIAAQYLQEALDDDTEISNSIKLQKAAMAEELAALEILMRDQARSYKDRADAAQAYIDKVTPIYDQEIGRLKKLKDAYMVDFGAGMWSKETMLNPNMQGYVKKFLEAYGKSDVFAELRGKTLMETMSQALVPYDVAPKSDVDIRAQRQRTSAISQLQDLSSQWFGAGNENLLYLLGSQYEQNKNGESIQNLVDAIVAFDNALGQKDSELKRIYGIYNSAVAQLQKTEEEGASLQDTLDQIRDDWEMEPLFDPVIDGPEIDLSGLDRAEAKIDSFLAKWEEQQAQIAELNGMLEDALISSMSNGLQAITDMMMGIQDADASSVLAAFIAPFGDMAKNMGAMIMSYGISMDAFKKAFSNPYVAIAAGAGLMAIGAAISSGAQKLSKGSLGGGATSSYTGGGSYGTNPDLNYESTLTVEVVGRLSGSDIILAGQKTQNKWNR